MDYFTKNKMLFWCVIILVIVNAVTLTAFWFGRPGLRRGPIGRGADGQSLMNERLGLSKEQAEQFEQIRNEHFMRTRPLQDDAFKIRMHLLDELFAPEPDDAKMQELLTELGDKQTQFDKYLFQHFKEMKAACNDDQIGELKMMLRELIESTSPSGSKQGGPRRPGGPGPEGRPPMR